MLSLNIVDKGIRFKSHHLDRNVTLDLVYPQDLHVNTPLLLLNDGQDYDALDVDGFFENYEGAPFIFLGIHCNEDRLHEYGTSYQADYAKRGSKATQHMNFVIEELLPWVQRKFNWDGDKYFGGFSLGGLSALDIAWENPGLFKKVGVFSGSFWWRSKAYQKGYDNAKHRIMHQKVLNGSYQEGLKLWFQCGTLDEKDDRNNNGIIDAIDDTLDLIKCFESKGYKIPEDIAYLEIENGMHNFDTWKPLFPKFVDWLMDN